MVQEKTKGSMLAVQAPEEIGKLSEEELGKISGGHTGYYTLVSFVGSLLGTALEDDEPNFSDGSRVLIARGKVLEEMLAEAPDEIKILPGGHKLTKYDLRAIGLGIVAGYVPSKVRCAVKKLVNRGRR